MSAFSRLGADAIGLARICGLSIAVRWLVQVLVRIYEVSRRGDLRSADAAMGEGPFTVCLRPFDCSLRVTGPSAFSGIREIFVRDVYRRDRWVTIAADDVIVDLGANMGNFSALALATNPHARVVAVEPSCSLNAQFVTSLALNNGFLARVQLIRAFVGDPGRGQAVLAADPNYSHAEWISEDDLITRASIRQIGVLKCDIEGSEFGLLGPESKLLAMTRVLACEVHAFAGDVAKFVSDLVASGFAVGPMRWAPDGSVTLLATRVAGRHSSG